MYQCHRDTCFLMRVCNRNCPHARATDPHFISPRYHPRAKTSRFHVEQDHFARAHLSIRDCTSERSCDFADNGGARVRDGRSREKNLESCLSRENRSPRSHRVTFFDRVIVNTHPKINTSRVSYKHISNLCDTIALKICGTRRYILDQFFDF